MKSTRLSPAAQPARVPNAPRSEWLDGVSLYRVNPAQHLVNENSHPLRDERHTANADAARLWQGEEKRNTETTTLDRRDSGTGTGTGNSARLRLFDTRAGRPGRISEKV